MKKISSAILCMLLVFSASPAFGQFKDVTRDTSLSTEIHYLVDEKIIAGYPDGMFRPNEQLKKMHVATMLVKALNLPLTNLQNPGYKDVPATHPYYKQIAAGYTAGLFSKADYFYPESSISRGFMATLLTKAFNLKERPVAEGEGYGYSDIPSTHPYYEAIRIATMNHIVKGYPNGKFEPNKLLTRAHFSAFLARADSLRLGTFKPIRKNNYYFIAPPTTELKMVYKGRTLAGEEVWNEHLVATNDINAQFAYGQTDFSFWKVRYDQSGVIQQLALPITVGATTTYYPDGYTAVKETIVTTKGSLTINGKTYNDLVVLELLSHDASSRIYYAENMGEIAITDLEENFELYLTKVEAR